MKRFLGLVILMVLLTFVGCLPNENAEPTVERIYAVSESSESDSSTILVEYYEMSDGTWRTDKYSYEYRLIITGRDETAVKDITYVFLSNLKEISFEQANKSIFSSDSSDFFNKEDAILVEIK